MKKILFVLVAAAFLLPSLTSALTCPNLYRNLTLGMSGSDVKQLQVFLIETGDLAAGNAVGIFGQRTRAAVRSFQCREMQICSGSETTTGWGRVGPATRAKIQQVCGGTAYAQGAYYAQGSYSDQSKLTATPRSGNAPLSVTFTTQGKAHQWSDPNNPGVIAAVSDLGSQYIDFGDGSANFQVVCVNATGPTCVVNTTHTYARAGTYTARLVEYGGYCREPCPHVPVASVTVTVIPGTASKHLSCTSDSQCPSSNYTCEAISGYGTACAYTSGGQPVDPNCSSTSVITQGVCKLKEGRSCSTSADCVTGTLCHAGICTTPVGKECFPTSGSNAPLCSEGYTCRKGCGPPVVSQYSEPEKYYCVLNEDTTFGTMCPICLAGSTLIDTPSGNVRIRELQKGMPVWTTDSAFNRIEGVVTATSKVPVSNHTVVHLTLSDGRSVFVSAGHPTVDGRTVGELTAGDTYDGATITSVHRIAYVEEATYDLLPSGETGFYWAGGILLGSTLTPR